MTSFVGEIFGTMLLILLGNGVVANVLLTLTRGEASSWFVITAAWGLAVFIAIAVVAPMSGAHINPAVTLGLAAAGSFPWSQVPIYWLAQMIGAAIGAALVYVVYHQHFAITNDAEKKLAVFCTAPAIRDYRHNFVSEVVATFVFTFGVLAMATPEIGLGALDALPVGLLVLVIGLSLGGTTGYAINPARDLAPRAMHALLPIPAKRDSDWSYAWIPVLGPLTGALLAALVHWGQSLTT